LAIFKGCLIRSLKEIKDCQIVYEKFRFVLSKEQIRKLAEANMTEIRLGTREQKVKDKHKDVLKAVLALATISETLKKKRKIDKKPIFRATGCILFDCLFRDSIYGCNWHFLE